MINSGVARRAPRNARSCRGSASFPKPMGVPRGYAPLVAGHLKDGRGACCDRTPCYNFMIITEFRMLPS
jgi:hypothetical protein